MRLGRAARTLRGMLLLGMVAMTLFPGPIGAQVVPNRIEVTTFTCGEVLSLGGETRDRVLAYFNGYLDGKGGTTVWVAQVVGARVDRALAECKTTPTLPLLDAFSRAWKP
jgi:HdeA/HdeB family